MEEEKSFSNGTKEESGNHDYDTLSVNDFDGIEGTTIDLFTWWGYRIVWLLIALFFGVVLGLFIW